MPERPREAEHVWTWFCDLSARRQVGMAVNPISWADMAAYFGFMGVDPYSWEREAVCALDDAYLDSRQKPIDGSAKGAKALKGRMTGKASGRRN